MQDILLSLGCSNHEASVSMSSYERLPEIENGRDNVARKSISLIANDARFVASLHNIYPTTVANLDPLKAYLSFTSKRCLTLANTISNSAASSEPKEQLQVFTTEHNAFLLEDNFTSFSNLIKARSEDLEDIGIDSEEVAQIYKAIHG